MQDASISRANKTIKRIIYAAAAFAGFVIWPYYSGIGTVCSCVEGFVCDCTDYAIEAAETAGLVLAVAGIGLFVLSFIRGRPSTLSWI